MNHGLFAIFVLGLLIGSTAVVPALADKSEPVAPAPADAEANYDFGPYMAQLQRKIKKNWFPPKGEETKKVTLNFKVNANGQIADLNVRSSEASPEGTEAAKNAVLHAAPFPTLPANFKPVDISFTFDFNVWSGGHAAKP